MQLLSDLIARREDWLVERTIRYAKDYGYASYTSTLTEAWRSSVCGLSQPLIRALADYAEPPQLMAGGNYAEDSISAFGIDVARRHRSRGITLGLFLGLMKYYRQAYLDLLELGELAEECVPFCREFINRFYDRVELGFCSEWASQSESAMVRAAAEQNRALTNEKNKYLTIFESLKDPVVLLDSSGHIENANHAAAELFGGSIVSGAGYYGSDHLTLLESALPKLVGNEGECLLTTTIGPRSFEVKSQAMLDVSEKFAGTVLIFNDVSDYKEALEAAEQANRTKSAFLAAVSHEIRTPVSGIVGATALLGDTALNAQQLDLTNVISISSEILASLISDILDYSKIEAGALEVETIDFTAGSLINDVLTIMVPAAAAKGLSLTAERSPELSAGLRGDFGKLRQILLNLVGNAVKFTDSGSVHVCVGHIPASPGAAVPILRFTVTDTGIGIPEESQDKVFSAFVQADASVARKFGGTGLGLAICQKLVTALDGRIGVTSVPGRGSEFWFEVPIQVVDAANCNEIVRGGGVPVALSVLVVDDNEINRLVARGLLERAGHRVVTVASGTEALTCLDESTISDRFDLVLMDISLPGISGLETIRRLRQRQDPTLTAIPIIVVSALVTRDDIETSRRAGADAFLGKPYRPAQLEAAVASVLRNAEPCRAADPYPGSGVQQVDREILSTHAIELGVATTEHLIDLFVESAPAALRDAQRAFADGDRAMLSRTAHRLKSSAATIGLRQLAALLQRIEDAADVVQSDGNGPLNILLRELGEELFVAIAALTSVWQSMLQETAGRQMQKRSA